MGKFCPKDDLHLYFFDSDSCYDVIGVEKSWNGWKRTDTCLNWPKWSIHEENIGIEVAGALYHFRYYEGVQLFPIIVYDERVKKVEVTFFEKTETKEVTVGEWILFTFDATHAQNNTVEATAYDAGGQAIYRLDDQPGRWIWVPVEK